MNGFEGTGVALVTPFAPDGSVDEVSLHGLVDYVIAGGVDYLVVLGTTSETATLSAAERCRVVEIILDVNRKRLPVMVGIGGNNTEEVKRNIAAFPYLKECQALLSVTPYYNKPSQEGMYQHFRQIAGSACIPVFLYNVPGRTGINMEATTVNRLASDCPNIIGVKEASGNFQQVTDILAGKRNDFTVVSGDDGLTLPLISIGAEGVISVVANLFPAQFGRMVRLARSGNYPEARKIHLQLAAIYKALFAEGNPAGIKAALHAQGIIQSETLRLPLAPVSRSLYEQIKNLCQSI